MTGLKRWVQSLLGFSRGETNAFLILLPMMAFILFAPSFYYRVFRNNEHDEARETARLDSIVSQWSLEKNIKERDHKNIPARKKESITLFYFNPNNASENELQQLGLPDVLIKRIKNYREKGGSFQIKKDFLKIYGLDSTLYNQLQPYIILPEHRQTPPLAKVKKQFVEKARFDLNKADTATLKLIYGIGTVLANRIVKYRESLGGFITSTQVNEIYGLDSAGRKNLLEASFIDGHFRPRQININTASENELAVHPYINKATAKALVTYRFQHGKFNHVEEIRNIVPVKPAVADKIIPYLTLE